jgi:hypothetical protein
MAFAKLRAAHTDNTSLRSMPLPNFEIRFYNKQTAATKADLR